MPIDLTVGWRCPVCNTGNAPHALVCGSCLVQHPCPPYQARPVPVQPFFYPQPHFVPTPTHVPFPQFDRFTTCTTPEDA